MKIRSLVLTAVMGLGTLTLAGCVEGGGYSGAYVTSYGGPYYNDGFYGGYGDGYYHGYRRDGRYYRGNYADRRRDYGDRRRDNDRPRGPGRDFHGGGGNNGNGPIILPAESPRGPMFSRGGN